jgi:hypothetical protein
MDLEPCGSTRAHLYVEAELGNCHRPKATWHHESPPLHRGETNEPPRAQSHMAAREPTSARRWSQGAVTSLEPQESTSMGR